ncbi:putative AC transposase [Bienertia sinuspersici]
MNSNLSKLATHVLAIPITTMASKATFSAGGSCNRSISGFPCSENGAIANMHV